MEQYMRVEGGAHYPRLECPPPLMPNSEVFTDKIEIANLMQCNKN